MKVLSDRFIGDKHKFFNQLFSSRPFSQDDVLRFSFFVDENLRFLKVKVDGSAFHPLAAQNRSQVFHVFKHRDKGLILLFQLFIIID